MSKLLKLIAALLAVLVLAVGVMPVAGAPAKKEKVIFFGVETMGGPLYATAAGLTVVIDRHLDNKAILRAMPGALPILDGVAEGKLDLALDNLYWIYSCTHGVEKLKEKGPRPLRVLGAGNSGYACFFTTPETGIKTIKDLVGKKVAYISGVSQSSTLKNRLMLDYYGITDKVVAFERGGLSATADRMIEGKIDAYGGSIGGHCEKLKAAKGIVVIPVPPEVVDYMNEREPLINLVSDIAPKGLYGIPEDVPVAATTVYLFTNPYTSEDLAYAITKAVYDHAQELAEIHRTCGEFNLKRALKFPSVVAYHAGAIKYYKEKGIWTKELDDLQRTLLAKEKR